MPTLIRSVSLLLLLLLAAACGSAPRLETGPMPRGRDSNRLSRDEVVATNTSTALDAIRMLRPSWLRKRGAMSVTQHADIMIYLDNVQVGGLGMLQSIPVNSITSLRFLDAATATQRWGTGHPHGAILVSTM
jgi:hypothetical protein